MRGRTIVAMGSGPEQCVGLAEALRAYTVNAARQDFAEERKGTVEAGKVADLCVLDRPLLDLDPHAITGAEVDLTVFDAAANSRAAEVSTWSSRRASR